MNMHSIIKYLFIKEYTIQAALNWVIIFNM